MLVDHLVLLQELAEDDASYIQECDQPDFELQLSYFLWSWQCWISLLKGLAFGL